MMPQMSPSKVMKYRSQELSSNLLSSEYQEEESPMKSVIKSISSMFNVQV